MTSEKQSIKSPQRVAVQQQDVDPEDCEMSLKKLMKNNIKQSRLAMSSQADVDGDEQNLEEDEIDVLDEDDEEDSDVDLSTIIEMYFTDQSCGKNVAEILSDIKKQMDKQNKILLKVAQFFMTKFDD
mgnify:CR=1 FL=1